MTNRKNFKKNLIYFLGCLLIIFALLPAIVAAQFNLPSLGNIKPTISLNSDPRVPLPNSTMTVTANLSGIIGTGGSNYIWFLNGIKQSEASGLNKNSLTFETGAIGTIYIVSVNIQTPNGELSETVNFTVSDIDLTWSADSQAPAAYRAKLMPTQNSSIILSALPFIYIPGTKSRFNSNNLIYNWEIDGKLDAQKSGVAKDIYVLKANNFFGNSYLIRLEARTADGAVSLNKFVTVPVVRPQVLLFPYDTKTNQPFGIALKNLITRSTILNFIAQTYFFNAPIKNLKWRWFINNAEISSENEKPWLAMLNLADNFSGRLSAQIQVVTANPENDLETGQSTVDLEIK